MSFAPTIDFRAHAAKLFTRPFHELRKAKSRYVVCYGGSSSSKSYSAHQSELIYLMQGTADTLVVRKYSASIRDSCHKLFTNIIAGWGLSELFHITYSGDNRRITYKPTGKAIVYRGLDDTEKIKSISGIGRILVEEASELNFDDFKELDRRARGVKGIQIVLLLNPISENHWIKQQLCNPGTAYAEHTQILKYTFRDNPHLLPEDVAAIERLKDIDENQYRIYALGEWGVEDKQSKFAWAFERAKHINPCSIDKRLPLWLSFDFNVDPITCGVIQHDREKKVIRVLQAYQLSNSDIWELCDRIKTDHSGYRLLVTGDASGRNRSGVARKESSNYYVVIKRQLGIADTQFRVPSVNPHIEDNRILLNAALRNYTIQIDPSCTPLIEDLTYVEVEQRDKGIQIVKDRTTATRKADSLDWFRYFLNIELSDIGRLRK